jgi:hypothetical protein
MAETTIEMMDYIRQNMKLLEGESESEGENSNDGDYKVTRRNMQQQQQQQQMQGGYVPSFEGYLSLGFSIHVPCDYSMSDCRLTIDDFSQGRLESLVMLFLCSQGVELVISTAPDTLIDVCPFNTRKYHDDSSINNNNQAQTKAMILNPQTPMIVWNLPRFESKTIAFGDPSSEKESILDMATNTTFTITKGPQQYYTQLNFTYPVYQWGEEDPSVANALQEELDTGVVSTGTLESLLPWPDAIAASKGDEPYVFWDEPLPAAIGYFDTTIPAGVGVALRYFGTGLIVANTLVCVMLSLVARDTRRRKEMKFRNYKKSKNNNHDDGGRSGQNRWDRSRQESDYLDTEAGVSAILMESKYYALTKSEAFVSSNNASSSNHHQQHNNNHHDVNINNNNHHHYHNGGGDRNITGVEVDLKMVDHAGYLHNSNSQQQPHYDHMRSPSSVEEKEDRLLARAKLQQQQRASSYRSTINSNGNDNGNGVDNGVSNNGNGNRNTSDGTNITSTRWFSGKKLLGQNSNDDDDDDYNDEDKDDLQILDIATPPEPSRRHSGEKP